METGPELLPPPQPPRLATLPGQRAAQVPRVPFEACRGLSGQREQQPAALQSHPRWGQDAARWAAAPSPLATERPALPSCCSAASPPWPAAPRPLRRPCRDAGGRGRGLAGAAAQGLSWPLLSQLPRHLRAIWPFRRRVGEEKEPELSKKKQQTPRRGRRGRAGERAADGDRTGQQGPVTCRGLVLQSAATNGSGHLSAPPRGLAAPAAPPPPASPRGRPGLLRGQLWSGPTVTTPPGWTQLSRGSWQPPCAWATPAESPSLRSAWGWPCTPSGRRGQADAA